MPAPPAKAPGPAKRLPSQRAWGAPQTAVCALPWVAVGTEPSHRLPHSHGTQEASPAGHRGSSPRAAAAKMGHQMCIEAPIRDPGPWRRWKESEDGGRQAPPESTSRPPNAYQIGWLPPANTPNKQMGLFHTRFGHPGSTLCPEPWGW